MARRPMAKRPKTGKVLSSQVHSRAIASVDNDITIAYFNDILSPLDDTLMDRGHSKGLKIYDELERDTHCWSVLQKRRHQLVSREWVVEAGGEAAEDIAARDFIEDVLKSLPFDQICLDLLDATLKGFAIAEVIYKYDGTYVTVDRIQQIDQRRIVFDKDWLPRLLTMETPFEGIPLEDRKFIIHRFGVKGNNPYGLGLGTRLFWPVLFKRKGISSWLRFLERFASPIPVGKYPYGASLKEQREIQRTLEMMNQASSIIVPLGTDLETFESGRAGNVDYMAWAKFWNSEMSKATLGETLTTEMGDNGARAASETHASILDQLVDADADLLASSLNNGLIRWLTDFNFPNAVRPKVWWPRPSNEMEQETLREKQAIRRQADLDTLERGRELGYEPADVETYMENVFGGPVKAIMPISKEPQAQKKTLKSA